MTEVKYNIGNGHEISVEYDEHNNTKISKECLEMLIDKEIPKKPSNRLVGRLVQYKVYDCPNCGEHFGIRTDINYCENCGQKIDWGNENNRTD